MNKPFESAVREVLLAAHRSDDLSEPREVFFLHDQGIALEEGENMRLQIPE